jgi:hypothetical protein
MLLRHLGMLFTIAQLRSCEDDAPAQPGACWHTEDGTEIEIEALISIAGRDVSGFYAAIYPQQMLLATVLWLPDVPASPEIASMREGLRARRSCGRDPANTGVLHPGRLGCGEISRWGPSGDRPGGTG